MDVLDWAFARESADDEIERLRAELAAAEDSAGYNALWKTEFESQLAYAKNQLALEVMAAQTQAGEHWDEVHKLRSELAAAKEEIERERMRLAACSTAALGYFHGCADEYRSAALYDVLGLGKKFADAKEEADEYEQVATNHIHANEELRKQLAAAKEEIAKRHDGYIETRNFLLKEVAARDLVIQQMREALVNLRWAASERDKKNRIRQFDEFMDKADSTTALQPSQEYLDAWFKEQIGETYRTEQDLYGEEVRLYAIKEKS